MKSNLIFQNLALIITNQSSHPVLSPLQFSKRMSKKQNELFIILFKWKIYQYIMFFWAYYDFLNWYFICFKNNFLSFVLLKSIFLLFLIYTTKIDIGTINIYYYNRYSYKNKDLYSCQLRIHHNHLQFWNWKWSLSTTFGKIELNYLIHCNMCKYIMLSEIIVFVFCFFLQFQFFILITLSNS